jgi:cyclophilin family peptidyl-prolyl cis-trans isomerase/predicted Ser/Thr protein kinase
VRGFDEKSGKIVGIVGPGLMEETPAKLASEGPPSQEERIGPYRVVRELGRGGMGTVYLCEDTAVGNRLVALKVVHDASGGTDLIERFRREIRNLGVLRHPNLVQVLYAGEHAGHPYFVMEYVRGRELNRWLDEVATLPEPQRIAAIVRLMAKVAHGVAHAHANGTIHRDLKPQNILVREDGEPMVLDFGIAKHREDTTLTATAATPGTPSHMAPEQFEPMKLINEELVDVWALGTILYLALTRERPFKGQSLASVSYQIVHGSPTSLHKLNPTVPPALEDLVLRCLEKDPRKRTPSAAVLAEKLESALHDVLHNARRKRTRAVALVAAGALVLAALALRPWRFLDRPADFGGLRPVVESVGDRAVGPNERELAVATFQPAIRVRFDEPAQGATIEAVLVGDNGIEFERALLAPGAGGGYEASIRVPPDKQREGMRVFVNVYANGKPLVTKAPALVLDTTPPRLEARVIKNGVERPWNGEGGKVEVEPGASLRVDAADPTDPVEGSWELPGGTRAPWSREPVPIASEGDWRAVLTVHDAAGNVATRTFEAAVVTPSSRPETAASAPSPAPPDPVLPEVWGRVSLAGSPTKPDAPASLKVGENRILVASALDQPFQWRFRLLDATGAAVAECDLAPESIFGTTASRTLGGRVVLPGPPKGRLLKGEFVIRDAEGRERRQQVASPLFLDGALKPRVTLKTSRGDLVIDLDRTWSPPAVEAFLERARQGGYDGTVFHEVRKEFVKGGVLDEHQAVKHPPRNPLPGPETWPRPKPTTAKMTVALVGESELLIHLRDNPNLDLLNAVEIGKVASGEDVIGAIAREAAAASRPAATVVITKATVDVE